MATTDTPLTISESLGGSAALDAAALLRSFENVRRQLSISLTGEAGAFAGYDVLELHEGPVDVIPSAVTVTAELVTNLGRTHLVRVEAFPEYTNESQPLARRRFWGQGRTVACRTLVPSALPDSGTTVEKVG